MTRETLLDALRPLTATIQTLDLSDGDGASAALNRAHPVAELSALRAMLREASAEGWLTPKRATDTLTFGRLAKPDAADGYAIDVVDMEGVGAAHTHTLGEVDLCFAEAGDPRFDGDPEGWVVKPPGSRHAPTVTGGRMIILYWLPEGAIAWG